MMAYQVRRPVREYFTNDPEILEESAIVIATILCYGDLATSAELFATRAAGTRGTCATCGRVGALKTQTRCRKCVDGGVNWMARAEAAVAAELARRNGEVGSSQ